MDTTRNCYLRSSFRDKLIISSKKIDVLGREYIPVPNSICYCEGTKSSPQRNYDLVKILNSVVRSGKK